jgi:hypothetical protein
MDRKNTRRKTVKKIKPPKGEKMLGVSASKPPRSSSSSSSDDIDEDYAEFLKTYVSEEPSSFDDVDEDYDEFSKTYVPEEDYPSDSLSRDEGSQITVEPKAKTYSSPKA